MRSEFVRKVRVQKKDKDVKIKAQGCNIYIVPSRDVTTVQVVPDPQFRLIANRNAISVIREPAKKPSPFDKPVVTIKVEMKEGDHVKIEGEVNDEKVPEGIEFKN